MQTATIIKIGNSLGVRLKHQLIEELDVKPGDVIEITVRRPIPQEPNGAKFAEAVRLAHEFGGITSIPDPVAWQREIRADKPLYGRDW